MAEALAMRSARRLLDVAGANKLGLLIPVFLLAFGLAEPNILAWNNIWNILIQASYMALFVAAQSIVILCRGFDLSLGTAVSLISVVAAMAMVDQAGAGDLQAIAAGFAAALAAGAAIGAVNGFFVAFVGINPFVVTLGTFNILLALASTVSGGFPVTRLPKAFSATFNGPGPLDIPLIVWIAGLTLLILHLTLRRTVFGRALYQIGANPRAAAIAGMRVRLHLFAAYLLCAQLIALGALMMTARTGSGEPNLGGNLALETIAAAVIGGMSLRGGEGGMLAPIVGALFVTVLSNGMNLMRVDGYLQGIALGVIIILGLYVDRQRRRQ
jgi:ribose transport system permease protein